MTTLKSFQVRHSSDHGWYIGGSDNLLNDIPECTYLRKDGTVGGSVLGKDGRHAYWSTEKEAKDFLEGWKNTVLTLE